MKRVPEDAADITACVSQRFFGNSDKQGEGKFHLYKDVMFVNVQWTLLDTVFKIAKFIPRR